MQEMQLIIIKSSSHSDVFSRVFGVFLRPCIIVLYCIVSVSPQLDNSPVS